RDFHVTGVQTCALPIYLSVIRQIQEHWTPLFDRFQVPLVFEFQDHYYKRTSPVKGNRIDSEGTIYIGHGNWNPDEEQPELEDTAWYLDKVDGNRNLILISLFGTERYIRTVNEFGHIVDEYPHLFENPAFSHTMSTLLPKGGVTLSAELATTYGKVS